MLALYLIRPLIEPRSILSIEAGAKINEHDMVYVDDPITAKLMLEYDPELIDARDEGITTLMYACMEDNVDVIKVLLDHPSFSKANLDMQTDFGNIALTLCKSVEAAKLLIEHPLFDDKSMDIHAYDNERALVVIADHAIVKLLLTHITDIDERDDYGRTALSIAVNDGNYGKAEVLLRVELIPISLTARVIRL